MHIKKEALSLPVKQLIPFLMANENISPDKALRIVELVLSILGGVFAMVKKFFKIPEENET